MADMTNLYGTQKNIARFPPTNLDEIKTFIGVHIVMGNLQFPRVCMYWHRSMGIPLVKDSLSLSRFYKLRQTIYLVDILSRNEDNKDRLWKVRCLYESVRKRCQQLPLETNLCVDEQIVPFKGQINIKQYMKNKPNKWGIKIYILAGQSGLIYDFLIYQGSTTPINPIYVKYGSAAAVVMQLSERISEKNHGLFFDNFFSTYKLIQYLDSIYKVALKPIWTYGVQLWGTAANSNIEILERFQSKVLRTITNAPWFIPNREIRDDLQVATVKETVSEYSSRYLVKLENHPNNLALNLLDNSEQTRRLRRHKPLELPHRF
ncbi:piggyBac transposable element-derived protein 4-like [Diabrotica virgifera virgifera]|uniref:PiggyBac transposable element-derived protein domain-containing protein n=1 Tax=Diabrotica virgifera virgifera TaxID=50390 RepID=A0ABM5JSW7_DIAVI|nr:piggyBac transposable element-derived protein 4-like [Diabrotica virgifera virgifera]